MPGENVTRRPIAARNTRWASSIAGALARKGISPNSISVASVVSAGIAGGFLAGSTYVTGGVRAAFLISDIVFIQGRLLCNLFDGMVAVEGGRASKSGEIFNELPDRIADGVILVCAGYGAPGCSYSVEFGWAAGLIAILTAYVRALGASCGAGQQFVGPMAKQQRMFIISLACIGAAIEAWLAVPARSLPIALLIIIAGGLLTAARRTIRIVRVLEAK